jgi:hypothetical protein
VRVTVRRRRATIISDRVTRNEELQEAIVIGGEEVMAGQLAEKSKDLGKNHYKRIGS